MGVSLSKDYVCWRLLVVTPGQYLCVFANAGESQQSTIGIVWSSLDSSSVKLTWCLQPKRSYIFVQHKLYFSTRVRCVCLHILLLTYILEPKQIWFEHSLVKIHESFNLHDKYIVHINEFVKQVTPVKLYKLDQKYT